MRPVDFGGNGLFGPMQQAQRSSIGAGSGITPANGPGMQQNRWNFGDTGTGGDRGPGPAPGGGMGGGGPLPLGPTQGSPNGGWQGPPMGPVNVDVSPLYDPTPPVTPPNGPDMRGNRWNFGDTGGETGMGGGGFNPMGNPHGFGKFGPTPDPVNPWGGRGSSYGPVDRPPYIPPGPPQGYGPMDSTGPLQGYKRPGPNSHYIPAFQNNGLFAPMAPTQGHNPVLMNPWLRNYLMQRRGF